MSIPQQPNAPQRKSERFVRPKKATRQISQDEIAQAILNFQNRGGLISKLPPQVAIRRDRVSLSQEGAFESIGENH
ncbi:MAG: hypothetical protein OEV94_08685 [Deltaproteobacteria bacterium]|nr:hypothetical protein [Deltaproteobacteria bacterium]